MSKAVVDIALEKKRKGRTLEQVLDGFVTTPDAFRHAVTVEMLYFAQRKELHSGRYDLPIRHVPDPIADAFSKYLYEELFDDGDIWTRLGSPGFNREKFHENYRRDNEWFSICPYCDLDTINGQGNYVVEHFLPREHFPLLAVEALNLFTACNSCNFAAAGKGTKVVKPVGTPYFIQAGDYLRFTQDAQAPRTNVDPERSFPAVEGLIELLGLRDRYGKIHVYHQLQMRIRAFEESVMPLAASSTPPDEAFILSYLARFNAGAPLYFALRSWVTINYIQILAYLNHAP